jgi:hypothetical protein
MKFIMLMLYRYLKVNKIMKKIILVFTLLISLAEAANAQVSIIPKGGVNFSNVRFDNDHDVDGQKVAVGFSAGVGIKANINDNVFFQPELMFTQKGFSAKKDGSAGGYNGTYRLNYLQVPILFGLQSNGDEDAVKVYVNAGPSIGYLLGGTVKGNWDILGFGDDVNKTIKFTDDPDPIQLNELNANRVEVGIVGGGGVLFSVARGVNMFVDARYNYGLTDYNKETDKSRNSVFSITSGLQFKL